MTTDVNEPHPPSDPPRTVSLGDISTVIRPTVGASALQVAGIGFVGAWLAAFVALLLAKVSDSPVNPFTGAFQLVPTSAGAPFVLPSDVSVRLPVLSVLMVAFVSSLVWVRLQASLWQSARVRERLVAAVLAGLAFSAVATATSAIFPIKVSPGALGEDGLLGELIGGDSSSVAVRAASVAGYFIVAVVFALLVFVAVSVMAPTAGPAGAISAARDFWNRVKASARVIFGYTVTLAALTATAAVVFVLFGDASFSDLFLLPLAFVNLVVYAAGLGHLNPIETSYSVRGGYAVFQGADSETTHAMIFNESLSPWGLLFFLGVVVVFALSVVVSAKKAPASNLRSDFGRNVAASALSWALFGVLLQLMAHLSVSGSIDGEGLRGEAHASVGLAIWSFLVFAVWGALFECLRVFVAPALVAYVPAIAITVPGARFLTPARAQQFAEPTGPPPAYAPSLDSTAVGDSSRPETAEVTSAPTATAPEVRQVTVSKKQVAIGAGVLGVLVLAGVTYQVANSLFFGAKQTASSVAEAFNDGDTSTIADYLSSSDSNDLASTALLNDDVFDAAKPKGYSVKVKKVDGNGDFTTAVLTVKSGDRSWPLTVSLTKDGHRFGIFDDWTVTSIEVPTLDLDTTNLPAGTKVTANGHAFDADTQTLYALPGSYAFKVEGGQNNLGYLDVVYKVDGDGAELTSGADEDGNTFAPFLTPAAQATVTDEVDRLLNACIDAGMDDDAAGITCPSVYMYGADHIKYNLVSAPTLKYTYQGLGETGQPEFSVSTDQSGLVTAKGDGYFGKETDDVDVTIEGTVTVGSTLLYDWDGFRNW